MIFTFQLQFPLLPLFLVLPSHLLPLPHPLLLHFYSEEGRPPMDIKQTWNIKLHIKTKHLPCIKAGKGNPVEFPKLAEESETAPTPTDRNVY